MLNIIGLTLALIGSFLSLVTVMTSKYRKEGITWNQLEGLGSEFRKQKIASIVGFSFMVLGFLLQLISASRSYLNL